MKDSIHSKLNRVRKPRVHITYDVENSGDKTERELPFVMGVMGDYSGDNTEIKKSLKERKFAQVDQDNFDELLGKINPKLELKVDNLIEDDGTSMHVNLDFKSMDDFEPLRIVEQVEPLKKLMETRSQLRDLLSKADRSEALENVLEDILVNNDALSSLAEELGINSEKGE